MTDDLTFSARAGAHVRNVYPQQHDGRGVTPGGGVTLLSLSYQPSPRIIFNIHLLFNNHLWSSYHILMDLIMSLSR